MSGCGLLVCFFYFEQKTAYGMRISDWSSCVCSSDLRRLRRDPPRQTKRVGGDAEIVVGRQVTRCNRRCFVCIRRRDVDLAARRRSQIADAGSERREAMQRIAELVER